MLYFHMNYQSLYMMHKSNIFIDNLNCAHLIVHRLDCDYLPYVRNIAHMSLNYNTF